MVAWPLAPLYVDLPGAGGDARSWVNYKLTAARWYTATLADLIERAGFKRYVGVEMALDGALSSLNGAYDAARAGLAYAAERYLKKDDERPIFTPPHKMESMFDCLMQQIAEQQLEIDVAGTVAAMSAALEVGPDSTRPIGWLIQLKRLRNIPMHQDTAPRHIDVVIGSDAVTTLSVAGHGQDPVKYLEDVTAKMVDLTSPILELIDFVLPNGLPSMRPLR